MTTTWQSFLIKQGATFDGHQLTCFQNKEALPDTTQQSIISDLGPLGILQVSGESAEQFLQGQLTCDVKALPENTLTLGACCNNKGRMLANFYLLRLPDRFWLIMDRNLVDPMIAELKKYCAFFKAEMLNTTDQYISIGLTGSNIPSLLNSQQIPAPTETGQSLSSNNQVVYQLPNQPHCYQAWLTTAAAIQLWESLPAEVVPVNYSQWQLLDIQAGLAWLNQEARLEFIPQQFNMQVTGGISFKKGCYTGQEIVARMQYLGKQKNHLYRIQYQTDQPIPSMTPLQSHSHTANVGHLINSAKITDNQYQALAVLQDKAVATDDLYFAKQPNEKVTLLDLPYTV
ncbi:folate-binding protein YgfZ [Endozoicomonas sp. SM1973]|uniref:Folate-binding protein YgfZ n=1 Tax=Spartinivicinus marinus TaxID=2994442 RepID=A0A853I6S7_9GAMM|nr:folate-binding protein YgfZ [Spartinivicinus marinus]MCX4025504.1 folate-binding protein YgfZ [Spartinivicinus marinus]NYZ65267.1 folate-binding protein YgfZ [Spartinivicinus marinus]